MASSLDRIRSKVRLLTRSPLPSQITDPEINGIINDFILYDFPEELRLFALRETFTFYTQPNVDVYDTNTTDVNSPLYNFKNRYITVHPPLYIAGYLCNFYQDRTEFFNWWPFIQQEKQIATGDGIQTHYVGTITGGPFLQYKVLFNSIDINNNALVIKDVPTGPLMGDLIVPNNPIPVGTFNYLTGAYDFIFNNPPADGKSINVQDVPYVPYRSTSMLFYDEKFTLRPVPDQAYEITIEAYVQPMQLLNDADTPKLDQWWQYIAYGAAKKIFEDRTDMDSVQVIMPEFKRQERLVLRTTTQQLANERSSTIYTQNKNYGYNYGWWFGPY